MIFLARNLHSVRGFSSQPCLMTPEGICRHPITPLNWVLRSHQNSSCFARYSAPHGELWHLNRPIPCCSKHLFVVMWESRKSPYHHFDRWYKPFAHGGYHTVLPTLTPAIFGHISPNWPFEGSQRPYSSCRDIITVDPRDTIPSGKLT